MTLGTAQLARLRTLFGGRRGTARLAVLVAAVAVLAGLTIGNGVAAHAARSGYEQAWLADGKRGQVVQVDPVKGRANLRLQVARPGADISVEQGDGQLVIVDHTTGKVTSIDLGTLVAGGTRASAPGAAVKVLLAGSRMYLADLGDGTIQAVDPRTEAGIGTPWSAGTDLVDVGIDGEHRVWALDSGQRLVSLQWDDARQTLAPVSSRALPGTGTGSVIIGHDRGVTVVGAHGTVARVGTGNDSTIRTGTAQGPLVAPRTSPRDLVPVADPGNSTVTIIGSTGAVDSPTAPMGCDEPGGPVVFDGKVYVPCLGAGVVVVLDDSGHQVGGPIRTPGGGDPQLTVSGGHLIVSAPGASSATVIDAVGGSRTVTTADPRTPVQDPHQTPPVTPPYPPSPTKGTGHHDGNHDSGNGPVEGNGTSGTGGSGHGHGSTAGGGGDASGTASAQVRSDGTVLVQWQGAPASGGYTVTTAGSSDPLASVGAGATSATVTTLDPGTVTLTVHALDSRHRELWSADTGAVTVGPSAPAVTGLKYTATPDSTGITLAVTWNAAGSSGVSYAVDVTHADAAVAPTTETKAQAHVSCTGTCSGSISVTATSAQGTGSATTVTYSGKPSAGAGAPAQPTQPAQPNQPPAQQPPAQQPTEPAQPPAPVALPSGGQDMITSTQTAGNEANGTSATVTLTVTAPGDWQTWTDGSCSLVDNGGDLGIAVPCNATGWQTTLDYDVTGSHSYTVRATAKDGRLVESAAHAVTVRVITGGCSNGAPQAAQFAGGAGSRMPCEPMCGQVYCFAGSRGTADQPVAVTGVRRVYRAAPVATAGGSPAPWGWAALGAAALAAAGLAETLRRRVRR